MVKRFLLASLLSVTSIFTGFGFCESAELKFDAPTQVLPGEEFVVSVHVDHVTDLAAYQLQLLFFHDTFPSTDLAVLVSAEGTLFDPAESVSGDVVGGRYSMLRAGSVSGGGDLASFLIKSDPGVTGWSLIAVWPGRTVRPGHTYVAVQRELDLA